jgi:5'-nucleotidase
MIKRVYIDMDGVLCDYVKAYNQYMIDYPHIKYPQSYLGFFSTLEPITDAIAAVKDLDKYYDVWFATAPSIKNLHCYSEKAEWIHKYFGERLQSKMIIINNKGLLDGEYLIEDYAYGRGQETFKGEHIHFGTSDFPDWEMVIDYLDSERENERARETSYRIHKRGG